jgi:hypothetical protein
LKVDPESLTFRNVVAGNAKPYADTLSFTSQLDMLVELKPLNPLIKISTGRLELRAKNQNKVEVSFSSLQLNPSQIINEKVLASYMGRTLEIPVQIIVSNQKAECLTISPAKLDFGYVPRGTKKTIELKVTSLVNKKIKIKPNVSWIDVSNNEIDLLEGQPKTVNVTIQSSSMPTGKTFYGTIEFFDESSVCKNQTVPVSIETDNGIVLELVIDSNKAKLNGKQVSLDAPARIVNGRTMVPIRFISESFGCKVEWDAKEGKVTIIRNDITIQLWKGKGYAQVNTDQKKLDSPPIIIKGRTFVPLRFISEPFGAVVAWDKVTKTITIVWDPI